MDKTTIENKLREMIVERLFLQIQPEDIDVNASLIDTYGVDSVCLLEMVVGLEEAFGIIVEDTDFDVRNFISVAALTSFVQPRLPA